MRSWITLSRAEDHIKGEPVEVNVDHIDMFSPSVLNKAQTLVRVAGKEFIVQESVDVIKNKIGTGAW